VEGQLQNRVASNNIDRLENRMMIATRCPTLSLNISTSMGFFSNITGVMASIALASLIFVLTFSRLRNTPDSDQRRSSDGHVIVALLCAFFGLVVTSLLYGIAAGERLQGFIQGRGTSEEFLGVMAFAFSALALLFGIVLLVTSSANDVSRPVRLIASVGGPMITMFFVGSAAQDVAISGLLRRGADHESCTGQFGSFNMMTTVGLYMLPCAVLIATALIWILPHVARSSLDPISSWTSHLRSVLPASAFMLVLASAVISTSLSETHLRASLSIIDTYVCLGVTTVFSIISVLYLRFTDDSLLTTVNGGE
jgi:hypothetical protein